MVMLFLGERATQTKTEASPKSHLIFDQSNFFPQIMMGLFDGKPGNRKGTQLATVVAERARMQSLLERDRFRGCAGRCVLGVQKSSRISDVLSEVDRRGVLLSWRVQRWHR
jgi:hypothetical protein